MTQDTLSYSMNSIDVDVSVLDTFSKYLCPGYTIDPTSLGNSLKASRRVTGESRLEIHSLKGRSFTGGPLNFPRVTALFLQQPSSSLTCLFLFLFSHIGSSSKRVAKLPLISPSFDDL